ncbi:MAG: glycosyltransferase [Thermoanaerobaculia bacterium]|nr:glycosyltransferase [Thermoanaerobaculia bacterium]
MSDETGSRLRIALLGSRGIPARYGGYETMMEELAARLAAAGHEVSVYCRSHYTRRDERAHRGARLVVLPTLPTKHLDTPVHTLLSALHVLWQRLRRRGYDAALVVNGANALFVPLLRLGVPTALHVDGIERRRAKWGPFGRCVYAVSERLACRLPDALVTDADVIQRHYMERYGAESWMITYGVEPTPPRTEGVLASLGLVPGEYFLYVSRFEPENNPHRVAQAYADVAGETPLVMVGDAPYAKEFIRSFRDRADKRIVFPGAIYGDGYRELQHEALAYIHATDVGGTHPALVEAMGYGNCVVVNDTPENREVAGPSAYYFRADEPSSLTSALECVLADRTDTRQRGEASAARAKSRYSWDAVTRRYVDLFRNLTAPA